MFDPWIVNIILLKSNTNKSNSNKKKLHIHLEKIIYMMKICITSTMDYSSVEHLVYMRTSIFQVVHHTIKIAS